MEITRLADLKPRNVWEITDDAFDLYRERFALLASICAAILAPLLILHGIIDSQLIGDAQHMTDGTKSMMRFYGDLVWSVPLWGIAYFFQGGATAIAVRDILTGETTNLGSVYKRLFRKFFPLLFSAIIIGFLWLISLCFLIGPAVVLCLYAFTPQILLLEDRKFLDAAKRSRDIGWNYYWKILGLACMLFCITGLLSLGFRGIIELGFSLLPTDPATSTPYEQEHLKDIISTVASSVIIVLFSPISNIATTLLYYDLRVRREGLDIEAEAEEWNVPLAPDPFGGVLNPKVPKVKKGVRQ